MLDKGFKIAISGKGGVGKTSLSSMLAKIFANEGRRVFAIDADPDANLGTALGFPQEKLAKLTTIAEDKKLIKERTGAEPGSSGQVFKINPYVEDIPEKYAIEHNGISLMQMGNVTTGGSGCACPENTLLKQLLRHLVVKANDTIIVDMEAGLEHLGRGTAESVDAFIVVVEPGQRSIQTARNVVKLAKDLGVTRVYAVANKVRPGDEKIIRDSLDSLALLGTIPYDPDIIAADLAGEAVFDKALNSMELGYLIKERLVEELTVSKI